MEIFYITILQSQCQFWTEIYTSIPIPVSILSFVDNGLFVSQEKSYKKSDATLFYSYNIT